MTVVFIQNAKKYKYKQKAMSYLIAFCLYLTAVTLELFEVGAILTRDKENILFDTKHEVLYQNEGHSDNSDDFESIE